MFSNPVPIYGVVPVFDHLTSVSGVKILSVRLGISRKFLFPVGLGWVQGCKVGKGMMSAVGPVIYK